MVKLKGHEGKMVRKFSMGMKQRLGIAMAIFSDPSLLILDEPFNGLDPEGVYEMRELMLDLHRKGKTIFFSSHILSDIQRICTHIGFLDKGRLIFQGLKSDLLSSAERAVIIRTSDNERAKRLCIDSGLPTQEVPENLLYVTVKDDYAFSNLINFLVKADIRLFSVQNMEPSLEDIFLKLTSYKEYA
jgi:ABC-2 type transport system ATP-binding protein